MGDGSKIEWTDATANVVNGCSLASPGCTNCYAMRLAGTRMKQHPTRKGLTQPSKAGPVWTGEVRFHEPALLQVLRWRAPRMIFWNAHGDLFHENVPDEWIDRCFAAMALTPHHKHQVLTKRSARMREYITGFEEHPLPFGAALAAVTRAAGLPMMAGMKAIDDLTWPLPNVWLGVSVEDQNRADERIPDLLGTPAAVRWLSCEPLLGPIDLTDVAVRDPELVSVDALTGLHYDAEDSIPGIFGDPDPRIDWVVVGGESGPRPMHPEWAKDLRDQCAEAKVPFFFKQWGDWAPVSAIPDTDEMDARLYHPARTPEGPRRCKVEQCVLQANGRRFDQDCWSRILGEDLDAGDFAFRAGTGSMTMMRIGKKAAGRLLEGVEHNGMPA